MTLRLNPRVTGTDRSCGHVQGTARTLFDSLGSTPYESQAGGPLCSRHACRCSPTCAPVG